MTNKLQNSEGDYLNLRTVPITAMLFYHGATETIGGRLESGVRHGYYTGDVLSPQSHRGHPSTGSGQAEETLILGKA